MEKATTTDRRRAAGQRTRAQLMDAALDLIAERGEEGVTLRDLTDAAGANVAAVSYHFGSLKSLRDSAIEQALERYLDAQQESVWATTSRKSCCSTRAPKRPRLGPSSVGLRPIRDSSTSSATGPTPSKRRTLDR